MVVEVVWDYKVVTEILHPNPLQRSPQRIPTYENQQLGCIQWWDHLWDLFKLPYHSYKVVPLPVMFTAL